MRVICCYCKKDLGDKAPFDDNRVSHGACEACAMKDLARQLAMADIIKTRRTIKSEYAVNPAY